MKDFEIPAALEVTREVQEQVTTGSATEVHPRLNESSPSLHTQPSPRFAKLENEVDVDVAIIGGGITGITLATLLKQAGKTVAVVDARRIGQGETGRTTAHLTAYPDAGFRHIVRHFGGDAAREVWMSGSAALAQIETLIKTHAIECDRKRVSGYLFTERAAGVEALEEEARAAREAGIECTLMRSDVPLPYDVAAAVRFENQARFKADSYVMPLARAVASDGSHVFEDSPVVEIEQNPSPRVITKTGVIRCQDIVVAAHVPIDNRVLIQTKIAAYRSYAIAARLEKPIADGLFWDDLDPYHYVRLQEFDGVPFLIVGGEDHRTGQAEDTVERSERLHMWARERFPIGPIERRWSGQIIESVDGLPYIGRNSFSQHVFEATGFGGNGMTFGTLSAMLICDLVLERENPWEKLYDATRVTPVASARDYVKENASFPVHFLRDRFKHASDDIDALPREHGGVFRIDGEKVAVYRDARGELHGLLPTCTHLGCMVDFNAAEKTWDCPCHGARYDPSGKVLNGPAVRDLEQFPIAGQMIDGDPALEGRISPA